MGGWDVVCRGGDLWACCGRGRLPSCKPLRQCGAPRHMCQACHAGGGDECACVCMLVCA